MSRNEIHDDGFVFGLHFRLKESLPSTTICVREPIIFKGENKNCLA